MRRPCFTLIELIVAVAIITLLMAIMLPALRKSKQQTQAILCGSNMKQLLFGFSSYENEYHTLPYGFDNQSSQGKPPGGCAGSSALDKRGWWWFNFIGEFYTKSNSKETITRCPSKRLNDPMIQYNILYGNYGANQSVCKSSDPLHDEFKGKPIPSSNILMSGKTLLIVDSGYAMINWWHATDEPPDSLIDHVEDIAAYIPGLEINEERELREGQEYDAIYGRHLRKTVNVGFADDHVSRVKADTLLVEKAADSYKNKSPLWVPN